MEDTFNIAMHFELEDFHSRVQTILNELHIYDALHKMDGQRVQHEVMRSVNAFLVAYLIVIATSILIVSLHCEDMVTSFTSVVTCINNVGPGLNQVGPAANFGALHPLSKIVLTFDMLAGRLELFPMLLLFAPETWRRNR